MMDLDHTLIDRQAGFRLLATRFLGDVGRDAPEELAWMVELDGLGHGVGTKAPDRLAEVLITFYRDVDIRA
jgi:hypothetical protein